MRLITITASASAAFLSNQTGTPRAVAPSCTTSIVASMGQPIASGVKPSAPSSSVWLSARAPPWLPMAGTMNGCTPRSRSQATTLLTTAGLP